MFFLPPRGPHPRANLSCSPTKQGAERGWNSLLPRWSRGSQVGSGQGDPPLKRPGSLLGCMGATALPERKREQRPALWGCWAHSYPGSISFRLVAKASLCLIPHLQRVSANPCLPACLHKTMDRKDHSTSDTWLCTNTEEHRWCAFSWVPKLPSLSSSTTSSLLELLTALPTLTFPFILMARNPAFTILTYVWITSNKLLNLLPPSPTDSSHSAPPV